MENNKIIVQCVNFDRIDMYINMEKVKKEYRSDKKFCWLTTLKYHSIYIIVFLIIVVGIILTMIEYPPTSLSEGYWLFFITLSFVDFMGFIVIGRFIQAFQNYQSELNLNCSFDLYFMLNHKFKYILSSSDISKGTFFIKEGIKTTSNYVLCYRNKDEKVNTNIETIESDTIQAPEFDIVKMTLYIPKDYKMPTGKDAIYVNIDKIVKEK